MKKSIFLYVNVFLLSGVVLCFEIISTRISSVIFVSDYAFIILSLAILGLGSGGIYCYYRVKENNAVTSLKIISRSLSLFGVSLCLFIILVIKFSIVNPFLYFFLLFLPFFFAGIVYAQLFKTYAEHSFLLYASDLSGAAIGSIASLGLFSFCGAPNSILLLTIIVFGTALSFNHSRMMRIKIIGLYTILFLSLFMLLYNGKNEFMGRVPIGNFLEKDFYTVYSDPTIRSQIIDSRWSLYGRSDLVQYSHQDVVKQLFIDGAAGTQMYRFNGNVKKPGELLINILLRYTNSIPFLCFKNHEKNNMLIIGPGGGKEVLLGLMSGVEQITGVEINPDFVDIIKEHKNFDGGIYTDFSNVHILVQEGRHFVKRSNQKFDLVVMALPSTKQMQNIEALAQSENYLVTCEAIQDYLKILTPEGSLIFTVHNKWELMRLITTTISAFKEIGVDSRAAINHFAIVETDDSPTIVIKNDAFTQDDITHWQTIMKNIPQALELPRMTFLPYRWDQLDQTDINRFLMSISQNDDFLNKFIELYNYNISPCRDDSPYFYKIKKGAPNDYLWLLLGIIIFNIFIVTIPQRVIRKNSKKNEFQTIAFPLTVFSCIGIGFMIMEVSLFQKLVLYLGSPTISLSILLSSLLTGMGMGSYWGRKIYETDIIKRLSLVSLLIVLSGIILFLLYPYILSEFLVYSQIFRSFVCFFMVLPFGFLLGIPFPSCIQLLKQRNMEIYIPWMYGVNGAMSVLGSVIAVILSMMYGFTAAFFAGLSFYFFIFILLYFIPKYK
jgi:Spermidine synthase